MREGLESGVAALVDNLGDKELKQRGAMDPRPDGVRVQSVGMHSDLRATK